MHAMKLAALSLAFVSLAFPALPQEPNDGPTNEKAQKTYKNALQNLKERQEIAALDEFKRADKQDGGHCLACQKMMIKYGVRYDDWKTATLAAEEMVANAQGNQATALGHYQLASVVFAEGLHRQKEEFFARAHDELTKALAAYANFPDALFLDGRALAYLRQDDAAKARFEKFVGMKPADNVSVQRARLYITRPELARARMAPAFAFTALDGSHISTDDLQGKVVLLDFWATWCGPCREALPHIKNVAGKFQGETFDCNQCQLGCR
jgi:tetratricopeptide (TPR) repeat protein